MSEDEMGISDAGVESGRLAKGIGALCVALSLFQLAVTYWVSINPLLHVAVFLAVSCALVFLMDAERVGVGSGAVVRRWSAWLLGVGSLACGAYFLARFSWIEQRWPLVDALTASALACGVVLLVAVFEATRRAVGLALVVVMAVFLAYALFGHLTDGLFHHRALSFVDVIDHLIYTANGVLGAPIAVAATYVYVFVMFGTVLELSGGGDFMFQLATSFTGRSVGGPAKIAVVSSALYGSISGSPTANVMTTGLFTIPLMKRNGFRPEVAGAVEATASTGGALLPPVMGSAAFLMVELTGIPYLEICIAAILPALLFYFSMLAQVHFGAAKLGLKPLDVPAERPRHILRKGWYHLLPLVTLVVLLVIGWSPMTAAGAAMALTVVASWRSREGRIGPRQILRVLDLSARRSLVVTAACAAAGVVVGTIVTTGLGGKITSIMFAYAGASLPAALLLTMIVCTVLGMGMPVPSAYVVTAVLAGPPLDALGLTPMSAHLFILYYASLSAITPPVAVAAFAAASIAGSSPNRVALHACRLGFIAFVIPFFFVYRPELLMEGRPLPIAVAIFTATIGTLLIAGALEGHLRSSLRPWERVLMFAGGLGLIIPGLATDIAGAVLAAFVLRRQVVARPAPAVATNVPQTESDG